MGESTFLILPLNYQVFVRYPILLKQVNNKIQKQHVIARSMEIIDNA